MWVQKVPGKIQKETGNHGDVSRQGKQSDWEAGWEIYFVYQDI